MITGLTTQAGVADDLSLECGAVIVGSGAGGATVAAELAEAGVDVIVLEEGGYHPTESFTAGTGRALRTLYRDGGGGMAIGRPSVLYAEGRCVGGSTVVNGGMSWRTPARVLQQWAEQEGLQAISEQDLDPYFTTIESRLSVGRQDPETIGRDSQLLRAGAQALGWNVVENLRNQLHCAGSNSCSSGCPTGAKRSMLVTSVPRALALGARLFADCRVDRVIRSGSSGPAVTGVTGRFIRPGGRAGPRLDVRARVVIVGPLLPSGRTKCPVTPVTLPVVRVTRSTRQSANSRAPSVSARGTLVTSIDRFAPVGQPLVQLFVPAQCSWLRRFGTTVQPLVSAPAFSSCESRPIVSGSCRPTECRASALAK